MRKQKRKERRTVIDTAVLISIKPKWVNLILAGKKTIEVRKTIPKLTPPFTCYIYESGTGCVVGEFLCDKVFRYTTTAIKAGADITDAEMQRQSCLTEQELSNYEHRETNPNAPVWLVGLYGWHICLLKEYDTPLPLSEFKRPCMAPEKSCCECQLWNNGRYQIPGCALVNIKKPPQSWRYVQKRVE